MVLQPNPDSGCYYSRLVAFGGMNLALAPSLDHVVGSEQSVALGSDASFTTLRVRRLHARDGSSHLMVGKAYLMTE